MRKLKKLIALCAAKQFTIKHKKICKTLHIDITTYKSTSFITTEFGCPNKTSENIMFTHKTLHFGGYDGASKDTYKARAETGT